MNLLFYIFSSFALVSGIMVIEAKNPVYSVLFLILVFFNIQSAEDCKQKCQQCAHPGEQHTCCHCEMAVCIFHGCTRPVHTTRSG